LAYIYGQIRGVADQDAIRVLVGQPNYRCFLAFIDGTAAGLGILHIKNGAASMANGMTLPEFRGRGVQTALLYHRMRIAAEAGCSLMVSQCQAGSISQRNQQRIGFQIAGTKVWWVRRE
jgi:GNAT superfamily N-acetyltransferase